MCDPICRPSFILQRTTCTQYPCKFHLSIILGSVGAAFKTVGEIQVDCVCRHSDIYPHTNIEFLFHKRKKWVNHKMAYIKLEYFELVCSVLFILSATYFFFYSLEFFAFLFCFISFSMQSLFLLVTNRPQPHLKRNNFHQLQLQLPISRNLLFHQRYVHCFAFILANALSIYSNWKHSACKLSIWDGQFKKDSFFKFNWILFFCLFTSESLL